jgi:hypothetical protein
MLMLVAMLLVSLVSGCSVLKPDETIIRDAEKIQSVEGQVNSPKLEAETDEHDSEGTVNDADAEADGDASQTEAVSSTDSAPISSSGKDVTPDAEGSGAAVTKVPAASGESTEEANDAGTSTVAPSTPTLITKSENAVTEAERVELFNTIGFELDELIRLLDSLDTVQESDLNLDEFEE